MLIRFGSVLFLKPNYNFGLPSLVRFQPNRTDEHPYHSELFYLGWWQVIYSHVLHPSWEHAIGHSKLLGSPSKHHREQSIFGMTEGTRLFVLWDACQSIFGPSNSILLSQVTWGDTNSVLSPLKQVSGSPKVTQSLGFVSRPSDSNLSFDITSRFEFISRDVCLHFEKLSWIRIGRSRF